MIAANNSYLLAFDNVSSLPAWLSDGRLASAGSFAVRQLYTDDDEVLFQAARPLLLNGIEEVISRPDLADRAIFLTLPLVGDARRQSERELWRQFELARPRILGALLDLVVHGALGSGRRAQTFLRALGIDIAFSRGGRAGNRIIRMRATTENTVSTVSSIGDNGAGLAQAAPARPSRTTFNGV